MRFLPLTVEHHGLDLTVNLHPRQAVEEQPAGANQ